MAESKYGERGGLDRIATIISTVCHLPGVDIDEVSEEFRDLFDSTGVVIAKGQGNFETMDEIRRKIYFNSPSSAASSPNISICRRARRFSLRVDQTKSAPITLHKQKKRMPGS